MPAPPRPRSPPSARTFALQITNPKAGTYAPYNHVHKKTDMDYLRLQGDLGNGFTIDNTSYTYAYVNKTLSTLTVPQTAADIAKGITETNGTIVGRRDNFPTTFPAIPSRTPIASGAIFSAPPRISISAG